MWTFAHLRKHSKTDKKLASTIKTITGIRPTQLMIYRLALLHRSFTKQPTDLSNERLEYLGDAMIGAITADFLFRKFSDQDEGFLSEARSTIVNRKSLNQIAMKMGIGQIIKHDTRKDPNVLNNILGNALEALIGAIFLDKGYKLARWFVVNKIIIPYFDNHKITYTHQHKNPKSILIQWAQKNNHAVQFNYLIEHTKNKKQRTLHKFRVQISVDGTPYAIGSGPSKKKAERDAALKTSRDLNII